MRYVMLLILLVGCGPKLDRYTKADIYIPIYNATFSRSTWFPIYGATEQQLVQVGAGKGVLAACNSSGEIYINVEKFEKLDEFEKENVMFHELGHCDAHLGHNDGYEFDGCPKHIMNSSRAAPKCYEYKRDQYIEDMKAAMVSGPFLN